MSKYEFKECVNDRYTVWYKDLPRVGNRIGVYKIIDLYKGNRDARFAFRYRPRKNQTQEESDNAIISKAIFYFDKKKPVFFGNRGSQSN